MGRKKKKNKHGSTLGKSDQVESGGVEGEHRDIKDASKDKLDGTSGDVQGGAAADAQQSDQEWPILAGAANKTVGSEKPTAKPTLNSPEDKLMVVNLPQSHGFSFTNTIHSTNTQIGDKNVIVDNRPGSAENPAEEKEDHAALESENLQGGSKKRSYANVSKPIETENLNIQYNFNITQDAPKSASLMASRQSEFKKFLEATGDFKNGHYILAVGRICPNASLGMLGLVPWTAVLDFDPDSRSSGLLSYVEATIEKNRSLHINSWQDKCNFTEQNTCWLFMRGSADRPDTLTDDTFKSWKAQVITCVKPLLGQLEGFQGGYTELTVVTIWPADEEIRRYINFTLAKLEERLSPSIVIVSDGNDLATLPCSDIYEQFETVNLSLTDVCKAIESKVKQKSERSISKYRLPTSDKNDDPCIDEREAHLLEEDLEVLYLENETGILYSLKDLQNEEEIFFRGGTLPWAWWYAMKGGHTDVERDIKDEMVKFIQSEHVDICKSGCVTLYHVPGSGGTTLAQRVLWHFKDKIPCAQVQHRTDQSLTGLADKVQYLSDKTHLPILLLMDGEEEQKIELIQRTLHCCLIIFYIKRCPWKPKVLKDGEFWLKSFVSKPEVNRLGLKYLDQCNRLGKTEKQKQAINRLVEEVMKGKERSIFEFGLAVHSYEYKGIRSYVKGFLRLDQNENERLCQWQEALVMLSLAYYYGQTSVPCQLFQPMLQPATNRKVLHFEDFPTEMKEFIVHDTNERKANVVRISHYYVAKEILDQVLVWPKDLSSRQISPFICNEAKKKLAAFVVEFIKIAGHVNKNTASDTMRKVLIRTIISRDNIAIGENETQAVTRVKKPKLSQILEDVSTVAPYTERFYVLEELTSSFPLEPQFLAHLGRLYTICRPELEPKAEKCFRKALEICENDTKGKEYEDIPQNMKLTLMYIYHMYGNMFSTRVSKYTGRNIADVPRIRTEECEVQDIENKLLENTRNSCEYFNKCREITPPGCESSVGYIGEMNVRLMFCDFINRHTCKDKYKNIQHLIDQDSTPIGEFVGDCFIKLDELFLECFSIIEPEKMDQSVWNCQQWYGTLFKTTLPGHLMQRGIEGVDVSRRRIAILKMKYTDHKALAVLEEVKNEKMLWQLSQNMKRYLPQSVNSKTDVQREISTSIIENGYLPYAILYFLNITQ